MLRVVRKGMICEPCRHHRAKCDKLWPACGHCLKQGIVCYRPTKRARSTRVTTSDIRNARQALGREAEKLSDREIQEKIRASITPVDGGRTQALAEQLGYPPQLPQQDSAAVPGIEVEEATSSQSGAVSNENSKLEEQPSPRARQPPKELSPNPPQSRAQGSWKGKRGVPTDKPRFTLKKTISEDHSNGLEADRLRKLRTYGPGSQRSSSHT